jgi:hypothetical protein
VALELQRIGDASEDAAVGQEVLAETLAGRRKVTTTVARRTTLTGHPISS